MLMWAWKIGPAVATGNCVVLKTAEQTPLCGLIAAQLVAKSGIPKGVVNLISGYVVPARLPTAAGSSR